MFEALRQAFREAVDNFHAELNRDLPPPLADSLRSGLSEAVRRLSALRSDIVQTREEALRETEELQACIRREEMASRVGDSETQRLAQEFSARHLRRKDLLERKVEILELELQDRTRELEDLLRNLSTATRQEGDALGSEEADPLGELLELEPDLLLAALKARLARNPRGRAGS